MTTATNNLTAGKVEVGLSLKPGQAPANLLIGQTVEAFPVGTGSGCAAAAGNGAAGTATARPATATLPAPASPSRPARSSACPAPPRSNGTTAAVTLAVSRTDAGILACYASAGDVAIALMPGTGSG